MARGKARIKALLQERLGLAVAPDAPLIGFVGRLTRQKGVDVIMAAAPALLAGSLAGAPCRWHAKAARNDDQDSLHQHVPAQNSPHVHQQSMQLVFLGTGEVSAAPLRACKPVCARFASMSAVDVVQPWMETALLGLERSFPGQAVGLTTFSGQYHQPT